MTDSPESTLQSPAVSSPTPSAPQVENLALDANPAKSASTSERYWSNITTRPSNRVSEGLAREASLALRAAKQCCHIILKDIVIQGKITTASLSRRSDKDFSPAEPPELVTSSEGDDER